MSGTRTHIAQAPGFGLALAAGLLAGAPLAADEATDRATDQANEIAAAVATWNAERARLVSEVCVATAPTFEGFAEAASAAGFETVNGTLTFSPEVVANLQPGLDGDCACFMLLGAPDQVEMAVAIDARLTADWADSLQDDMPNNTHLKHFTRDGETVRSMLLPRDVDGLSYMESLVIAPGECPT